MRFSDPEKGDVASFDGKLAATVGVSIEEIGEYAEDFERMVLVFLTGWTLDDIDRLSVTEANRLWITLSALRARMTG